MTHLHTRSAVSAIAAVLLTAAPAARAQEAAPAGRTITAVATSEVPINQHVEKTNAAVKAAIERSRVRAGPLAIALAVQEAQRLATAAGMTLGPLQAVAELPPSPFGPFSYGLDGTLGPGRWCGQLTSVRFVTRDGKRRRVTRRHYGCRIPREAAQTVSVTYAAS
jgi:hypothetical protein